MAVTAERNYTANVTGLTNGVAYTFSISGVNGSASSVLVDGIAFTGDSAAPPAVSGLKAVEV